MKLHIEHTFRGIDLAGYEKLYFDEPFNIELCQATDLERTLVRRDVQGNHLERSVKITARREMPGPVAKVVGAAKLQYTEHVSYDFGTYAGRWRTDPAVLPDKIESSGTFSFRAVPGGVVRVIDGAVNVRIFGLGGVVERFVVADVEKSYDRAAKFTQQWIDRHGGQAA